MLNTLAISNYRSALDLALPLGPLNVITGANGSGKSNLYRSLRLLAATARDDVIAALASEGGLESTFWAGPETLTTAMRRGLVPVQGGPRQHNRRLKLGFTGDDFGYLIELGLPKPDSTTAFNLDPEIKREIIWAGGTYRPASVLVDRRGPMVKVRSESGWKLIAAHLNSFDSLFSQVADANSAPEVLTLRERIRGWRFYDHFRTDRDAPARQVQIGTRTPVLNHDGHDLAAALQTIREIGDSRALDAAIEDAFPGARLEIAPLPDGRLKLEFHQHGLLRPLSAAELSDGTLRYLLLIAALLTPRPPSMMVLNEPENSLHPDLLPALARLIEKACEHSQLWVVSHANALVEALGVHPDCQHTELTKELGETRVVGQGILDTPRWQWPEAG
ncbi:AAA family ATPase [Alcanivorax sp. DP30]|uniref:AAA family ATPase n=1 Tax=Alcanivorax sp. DP30 TaxID=2606217 RepID=UPI00136F0A45|nr:AAA family ATPase [Alcanivorax sp. DP30]MZR63141.1 AAA family ATPase [Alcanivorax sp. DP30]